MKQFVIDNLSKVICWGAPFIFTLIVFPFLLHFLKNSFDKSKRIVIEGNEIKNINNLTGFPEQVFNQHNYFSNYILDRISIVNKSTISHSLTRIELFDIAQKDLSIEDVQFDGGFYPKQQKFALLAYNNGNLRSKKLDYFIQYTFIGIGTSDFKEKWKEAIEVNAINSGDVVCLWIKNFKEFYTTFENDSSLFGVEIKLLNRNHEEIRDLTTFVGYSRELKEFGIQLGSRAGDELPNFPLIDLIGDDSKKSINILKSLDVGVNLIEFSILLNRTCELEYKIALYFGNKEIRSKIVNNVKIRIPVYNQEFGHFHGDFYNFLLKANPEIDRKVIYPKNKVELLYKEIMFDMFKAPQKFSNFKR